MSEPQEKPIVATTTQARAGFWDRPVAFVLSVSLGLVVVLFAVIYVIFFGRA